MSRFESSARGALSSSWFATRAIGRELYNHWTLALLSLFSAGAIWFVIQDIENPRVQAVVPVDPQSQGIPVEFVNLSADYVVAETARVRVRVEAREADVPELRAGDFRATVDLQGIEGGAPVSLPVDVSAVDDSVDVLSVEPSRVTVELLAVERDEFQVEVNITSPAPTGFNVKQQSVEPAFVTVSGREELMDNIDRVEIDVNLSGQRQDFEVTGDLVARNSNGDTQTVTINPPRVRVSFSIEPLFEEKQLTIRAPVTGDPAAGHRVAGIRLDQASVIATGPKDVLDGLDELSLEPLNISGASSTVTQTRRVQVPANVSVRRESVTVEVAIEPIVCGANNPVSQCGAAVYMVSPIFRNIPAGLQPAAGAYLVPVRIAGPVPDLATLDLRTIAPVIDLANAAQGEASHVADVTVPAPFRVESVAPITIELVPAP